MQNKFRVFSLCVFLIAGFSCSAQTGLTNLPAKNRSTKSEITDDGFAILPGGVEYKIYNDVPGSNATAGQYIYLNLKMKADTQLLQSTWNDGKPAVMFYKPSTTKADYTEVFPFLSRGDSAVVRVSMDSIMYANPGMRPPPFFQHGKYVYYEIAVTDIESSDAYQHEMVAKETAKPKKKLRLIEYEDSLIKAYIVAHGLKAEKTGSGLYYTIQKEGAGAVAAMGQKVFVNFTGMLPDGSVFDSNTGRSGGRSKPPYEFILGAGDVIPGWDEGLRYFKKGTRGMLFVPSKLAYGAHGGGGIEPNSTLIFEIEVLDIK